MSPRLSIRLEAAASLVVPGRPMADIGCDHGQLAAALVHRRQVPRAIASDVRAGPLRGAASLVERLGVDVELRRGSGLSTLEPGEVATIVIAGMGGPLMMKLLGESPQVLRSAQRVVLQPNTSWTDVRRALATRGWGLSAETLCEDAGHRYLTLAFDPRAHGASWTDADLLLGPIVGRDRPIEFQRWLQDEDLRLATLRDALSTRLGADHPRVQEVRDERRQLLAAARLASTESTKRRT